MRKIVVFNRVSADGYFAKTDGVGSQGPKRSQPFTHDTR